MQKQNALNILNNKAKFEAVVSDHGKEIILFHIRMILVNVMPFLLTQI